MTIMKSTPPSSLFPFLFRLGLGATMSLYTPFLADIGLTFAQIATVNAVYWIATLTFEIPTGMLADGRGRGWSVMMGSVFYAIGGFWYSIAGGFWHAVSAELIIAVGAAFISGALSSWIVDAPDRKGTLSHVFGTATAIAGVATVLGTLLGVYLAVPFGRGVAFAIDGVFSLFAFVVAASLMQGKELEHPMGEFEALGHAFRHLRSSPTMLWAAAMQASYGIFQTFNMFWAPLLLKHLDMNGVGYTWIGMYAVVAASGFLVRTKFGQKDGTGAGMALALAFAAAPMIAFAFLPPLAAWFVLLGIHELGRGAFAPFADAYVHERIESGYRATFSSLQSFAQEAGMAATLIVLAFAMRPFDNDPQAIVWMWAIAGAVSLGVTATLWVRRPRLPDAP